MGTPDELSPHGLTPREGTSDEIGQAFSQRIEAVSKALESLERQLKGKESGEPESSVAAEREEWEKNTPDVNRRVSGLSMPSVQLPVPDTPIPSTHVAALSNSENLISIFTKLKFLRSKRDVEEWGESRKLADSDGEETKEDPQVVEHKHERDKIRDRQVEADHELDAFSVARGIQSLARSLPTKAKREAFRDLFDLTHSKLVLHQVHYAATLQVLCEQAKEHNLPREYFEEMRDSAEVILEEYPEMLKDLGEYIDEKMPPLHERFSTPSSEHASVVSEMSSLKSPPSKRLQQTKLTHHRQRSSLTIPFRDNPPRSHPSTPGSGGYSR